MFLPCVSQKRDFTEETDYMLSTVRGLLDDHTHPRGNMDTSLQVINLNFFSVSLPI